MPELPEAETVRRHLQEELAGTRIEAVRIHQDDILLNAGPRAFADAVEGERIRRIGRRGKWPLLVLDSGRVLEVQLRMTGRFVLGSAPPDPAVYGHLAAEFDLEGGRTLFYDDQRRLGGFNLWSEGEWRKRSASLGPEPLGDGFSAEHLAGALDGRRAAVKNLLLDGGLVAGVGNVYAAEALHEAGIDPRRPGGSLDREEVRSLRRALRHVLRQGLHHGGTSFSDFLSPAGEAGRNQEHLAVYGREGRACPRCGDPIRRIRQGGRSTYLCPACQS